MTAQRNRIPHDPEEVFAWVRSLEEALPLGHFKLGGVDAWPYMRIRLIEMLYREMEHRDPTAERYSRRLAAKGAAILASARHIPKLARGFIRGRIVGGARRPSDYVVLTDNTAKRIEWNGRWYDVFMEPLLERLESRNPEVLTLETSQRLTFRAPGCRPATFIGGDLLRLYLLSLTRASFLGKGETFDPAHQEYRRLLAELGVARHALSVGDVRADIAITVVFAEYFRAILEQARPKAILLTQYSGYAGSAMCHAGRRAGIPVVDVQHGVQGAFHPAYAYFNVPETGFNVLPTVFLVWSEHEKVNLESWIPPNSGMRAVVSGNLILEQFRADSALSRHFDQVFERTYCEQLGKRLVLMTLAWSHYLPEVLAQLIAGAGNDLFFLIRLHPSTVKKERDAVVRALRSVGEGRVEFVAASSLPLHCILRNVDIHVTGTSSVVLEALEFGVQSIITDPRGRGYFQYLIDRGEAYFCEGVEEALRLTRALPGRRYVATPHTCGARGERAEDPHRVWAEDWIFGGDHN